MTSHIWNIKIQQASEYNQKQQTHRDLTSSYQVGKGEGQYRNETAGDINYYMVREAQGSIAQHGEYSQ